MISYKIGFPGVMNEEEHHYLRQRSQAVGAVLGCDDRGFYMIPGLAEASADLSALTHMVGDYLRAWRRNEVISFMWICTQPGVEPIAEGVVVSSDGQSTISLRGLTAQRAAQVRKIYEPKHSEEMSRFIRSLSRGGGMPVTMILVRENVTPRKARIAMADPFELHSITKKIWCGDDVKALEPETVEHEWVMNEEPGMAVIAYVNPNTVVDHDPARFIELLRTYDPSKNPRSTDADNEYLRDCMSNRFFGRPFMLGPKGVFPRDAVIL